jgi:hypothetical protein
MVVLDRRRVFLLEWMVRLECKIPLYHRLQFGPHFFAAQFSRKPRIDFGYFLGRHVSTHKSAERPSEPLVHPAPQREIIAVYEEFEYRTPLWQSIPSRYMADHPKHRHSHADTIVRQIMAQFSSFSTQYKAQRRVYPVSTIFALGAQRHLEPLAKARLRTVPPCHV